MTQHTDQARIIKGGGATIWIRCGGSLAGRQKLGRARHIGAQTVEQGEIISTRHT